jgi:hypothetical protein
MNLFGVCGIRDANFMISYGTMNLFIDVWVLTITRIILFDSFLLVGNDATGERGELGDRAERLGKFTQVKQLI